ncbi:MAG TPA: FimV/HubP family polar landmark protein, partial [Rhodocyclaceae bacterium]|nr:FimV/HubP family polar landmark protein [Rhodocyclaceae bacterium]
MRAAVAAVASCLTLLPGVATAAGLGKITVLSGLGQPLRAEVELSGTRDELVGMAARLAPVDAFRQAGVEFPSGLLDLKFAVDRRANGKAVVRITSTKPINEPFLDFLVELNWPAGRLVREYTFLLDPPEVAMAGAGQAVSVAEAKPVEAVRGGGAEPATRGNESPRAPSRRDGKARAAEPAPAPAAGGATREVKSGDTLGKIARETRHEGVSLEQMLVGLFKSNSEAFIGGNMHRLK